MSNAKQYEKECDIMLRSFEMEAHRADAAEAEIAKLKEENEQLIDALISIRQATLINTGMKPTQALLHAQSYINGHVNRVRAEIHGRLRAKEQDKA